MTTEETEVLIVGAGPTGLVLAAALAAHGVRFRIIDQAPARSDRSRALIVHARTLELLDRFGLADALLERGRTGVAAALFVDREAVAHIELGDIGVDDTAFPFLLYVSQVETERVLEEHLQGQGVVVERPVRFVGFAQDDDGVDVALGDDRRLRCRYLVGCDGAHSEVRKQAGLRFDGAPYPQDFVLADVRLDWAPPVEGLHVFMEQTRFAAVFPLAKPDLWRVLGSRTDSHADDPDPTLEEMQALVQEVCPIPVRLHDPRWLARFRLHHRGVDRYRVGRVFVAGDAAHIHSPAGGQGMNTGMQDAFNLGWKLALALRGEPHPALLESYHAERYPVGRRLLEATDRAFSLMSTGNVFVALVRNFLFPLIAPRMVESRARRARAFRFASQLGVRYRASPVVEEVHAGGDAAFLAGPRAGDRAPDGTLKEPKSGHDVRLHTLLDPTRHVLLAFTGRDPTIGHAELEAGLDQLRRRHPERLRARIVEGRQLSVGDPEALLDDEGAVHRRFGVASAAVVVVRPDGVIGFRSPGLDLAAARSFLARQLS